MGRAVRQIIRACDTCQRVKVRNFSTNGLPQPIITEQVGELAAVDFFGPLSKSQGGVAYVFVVVELFSKYVQLFALKRATAAAAIKKIIDNVLPLYKPKKLLSDHGSQFTSKICFSRLEEQGIVPTFSSFVILAPILQKDICGNWDDCFERTATTITKTGIDISKILKCV